MQRLSAETRGARREDRGPAYRRSDRDVGQARGGMVQEFATAAHAQAERDRDAGAQGDPRAVAVPGRRRPRISDLGARIGNAVGRREPAHPARLADRLGADRRALRARRAVDRAASARQRPAVGDAETSARSRQHRDRGRARRGRDPFRRSRRRRGPGRRRARRPHRRAGHARRQHGEPRVDHRQISDRRARDPGAGAANHQSAAHAQTHRGARQQSQKHHRGDPARPVHLRDRRIRRRQVDLAGRHALQGGGAPAQRGERGPGALRPHRRPRASRQGDRYRPVADRAHAALQSRDLYGRVHADPRMVRRPAGVARARLRARTVLVQRQRRALRGLPGRRRHQDRDALFARRLRHLRRLQGQALQPRDARSRVQEQIDRRRARHDGRRGGGILQGSAPHPQRAGDAAARRARLYPRRPAGDDALGRRGAAGQAGQGAVEARDRPHPLHSRRADHGPAFPRRRQIARRAARAGRAGQFRGGDRAQSRSDQDRGLDHRPRPRRRRRRRRDRGRRPAGDDRQGEAQLHRPIPGARAAPPGAADGGRGVGCGRAEEVLDGEACWSETVNPCTPFGSIMMPRSLVYLRLAVAFALGIFFYFLYHAYELRAWPAGDQLIFASIVTVALFVPLILVAGVGNLRPWTLAIWIVIATAICAGLAAYNVYRGPIGNASSQWLGSSSHMRPAIIAILFVTHSLIVSGDAERHFIARYANYLDISWKHGVQLVLAGIFLGVFWALLFLGAKLFGLIRIELFTDLIKRPWFAIPATMLVLTLAIHITDLRPGIVRGTQTLMLTLLSWLLPMMALIAFGFTVALSFTGLDPLWNTHRATAILLIAAFALILLINSAYQDGGPEHFRAAPLRYSSVLAAVLLAPLLGLASYALLLRVQQYGWTPDRVITLACIAVAACYAVGYFVAALRSGLMLRELETTNVLTAFFIVVVLLALFTPIADPARISVADQVNRLQSGSIPPDKFDFGFLRFGSGRYGMAALQGLAGLTA